MDFSRQLYINEKDVWLNWNAFIEDTSHNSLLLPAANKEYISNKSATEHGKRVHIQNVKTDERDVQLVFCFACSTKSDFRDKYRDFVSEIRKGWVLLSDKETSTIYKLTYSGCQELDYYERIGKLSVRFNEPNPDDRESNDIVLKFVNNLLVEGIEANIDDIRTMYDSLPDITLDNAKTILFPISGKEGVVYGMDNITGAALPFTFSRATSGTYHSKDLNMHLASADMPRLDYGNYTFDAKLLIEKQATNYLRVSEYSEPSFWAQQTASTPTPRIDVDWFGFIKTAANLIPSAPVGLGLYRTVNPYVDKVCSLFCQNSDGGEPIIGQNIGNTSFDGMMYYGRGTVTKRKIGDFWRVTNNGYIAQYFGITKYNNNIQSRALQASAFQVEDNEATSYIPTYTNAEVTRSADNLSYTLANNCSVYLKTTKQNIVLDKPAGLWNIHEDLSNEGILQLAIFDRILTDDERLLLIDKFENFHARLRELGIDLSVDTIKQYYNSLPTLTKENSTAILFPIPGVEGKLLGMNNTSGGISEFTFARATSGTYFDKDLNMHLADSNMPRLDYGNYADGAKILIENASTNLLTYSDLSTIPLGNATLIDINWFNYIKNGRQFILQSSNQFSYSQSSDITQGDKIIFSTFVINEDASIANLISTTPGNRDVGIIIDNQFNGTNTYRKIGSILRFYVLRTKGTSTSVNYGLIKYPVDSEKTVIASGYQLERRNDGVMSSYIPTGATQVTRSADNLSYTLENDCSVYLKTTKQNIVLDKPAGLWNIHEELNDEGILMINIFNRVLTADEKAQLIS